MNKETVSFFFFGKIRKQVCASRFKYKFVSGKNIQMFGSNQLFSSLCNYYWRNGNYP